MGNVRPDLDGTAFPTDVAGLPNSAEPVLTRLGDGDHLDLRILPVAKRIGDDVVRMLGYNGSIPGPTLHVDQGSEVTVDVTNDGDVEATVHWHGLRLDNRYDGVPGDTQAPIPIGGRFTYRLQFPDAGLYWYHPHVREDFALEMGLYGTIVVEPRSASYWPPADRFVVVTLDDLLVEDGRVAPFLRSGPTFTAMGRFGNVLLTNGSTWFEERAAVGEVVRLYLVNTANTRTFDVALPGADMKLVGGDSGRYEREALVDSVLLAPSERAVVDVLFRSAGPVPLEHRTPDHQYGLGAFEVAGTGAGESAPAFRVLRTDPDLAAERHALAHDLDRPPDKVLAFVSLMPLLYGATPNATGYACPMHPEVTATEPGSCPKCGMTLVAVEETAGVYACPMHPEVTATEPGSCPKCGMTLLPSVATESPTSAEHHEGSHGTGDGGIEWEDLMPDINRRSDATNMVWKIIDRETGAENGAIHWSLTVGDRVKIRLVNEVEGSEHPMHHPFHVHGAGRFLVLSRDGVPDPNLVWKDTVLVRSGETVDIVLDVSNPGNWMAHCHIAEHAQGGMMFNFRVSPRPEG